MSATATPEDVLGGRARWCVVRAPWEEVLPALPAQAVDHVLSDAPYDERTHTRARSLKDGGSDIPINFAPLSGFGHVAEALRLARRWVLFFCALEDFGAYRDASGPAWVRACVWDRPDGTPQISGDRPAQGAEGMALAHGPTKLRWNCGGRRGTWRCGVEREDRVHPTQKPLELMLDLVTSFTDPDDLVVDPFMGSATTGVACVRLGRRFIGLERDVGHFANGLLRMEAESRGLPLRAIRETAGQLPLLAAP